MAIVKRYFSKKFNLKGVHLIYEHNKIKHLEDELGIHVVKEIIQKNYLNIHLSSF